MNIETTPDLTASPGEAVEQPAEVIMTGQDGAEVARSAHPVPGGSETLIGCEGGWPVMANHSEARGTCAYRLEPGRAVELACGSPTPIFTMIAASEAITAPPWDARWQGGVRLAADVWAADGTTLWMWSASVREQWTRVRLAHTHLHHDRRIRGDHGASVGRPLAGWRPARRGCVGSRWNDALDVERLGSRAGGACPCGRGSLVAWDEATAVVDPAEGT